MASTTATTAARAAATQAATGSLQDLGARADHSWLRHLTPDPDAAAQQPNKKAREVMSGHWVPVLPTPLPSPSLVLHSAAMAAELGLSDAACAGLDFARFFSGDVSAAGGGLPGQAVDPKAYAAAPLGGEHGLALRSWCTPYALSIMGTPYVNNCPFGTGNGYGDGRAASVGEVLVPAAARGELAQEAGGAHNPMQNDPIAFAAAVPASALPGGDSASRRWELQLKGAGTTPFCRGADGRAVLRSSVREFLASEAMHALGVPTTRALSLVASASEGARRAWYSGGTGARGGTEPDVVGVEPCAITCRASPSFTRIGHLDLHGRRARQAQATQTGAAAGAASATPELAALRALVAHAVFREYPHLLAPDVLAALNGPNDAGGDDEAVGLLATGDLADGLSKEVLVAFLDASAVRLASLTANWLRVGFCQGNFNADNCLVGGRTMDYGPFGFLEAYNPNFAKWVGSGEHFAFANQPQAGFANWQGLAVAGAPVLASLGGSQANLNAAVERAQGRFGAAVEACWARKLGLWDASEGASLQEPFGSVDAKAMPLFEALEPLLRQSKADFTIFFRQLAVVVDVVSSADVSNADVSDGAGKWDPSTCAAFGDDAALAAPLRRALPPAAPGGAPSGPTSASAAGVTDAQWAGWLRTWLTALAHHNREPTPSSTPAGAAGAAGAAARLRLANPKYVAREWMLVDAYEAAAKGDFSQVHRLHALLQQPYAEQGPNDEADFYRRNFEAERKGGVAFMT